MAKKPTKDKKAKEATETKKPRAKSTQARRK